MEECASKISVESARKYARPKILGKLFDHRIKLDLGLSCYAEKIRT